MVVIGKKLSHSGESPPFSGPSHFPDIPIRMIRSIEKCFPSLINNLRSLKNRWRFRRLFRNVTQRMKRKIFGSSAPVVATGPFKGMHYFEETVWGPITPKWLGSYEAELHGVVEEIRAKGYETIIDVGSAEGYYAIGLALVCGKARMHAFDSDFISRGQVRRLAALNSILPRISIRGLCSHADIVELHHGSSLLVCDIEGYEKALLDPAKCGILRKFDILVELHDPESGPSMESVIAPRFATSHQITRYTAEDRGAWVKHHQQLFPDVNPQELLEAANEYRTPGQAWLWMKAGN